MLCQVTSEYPTQPPLFKLRVIPNADIGAATPLSPPERTDIPEALKGLVDPDAMNVIQQLDPVHVDSSLRVRRSFYPLPTACVLRRLTNLYRGDRRSRPRSMHRAQEWTPTRTRRSTCCHARCCSCSAASMRISRRLSRARVPASWLARASTRVAIATATLTTRSANAHLTHSRTHSLMP